MKSEVFSNINKDLDSELPEDEDLDSDLDSDRFEDLGSKDRDSDFLSDLNSDLEGALSLLTDSLDSDALPSLASILGLSTLGLTPPSLLGLLLSSILGAGVLFI